MNRQEFEKFFEEHHKDAYRFALSLCRQPDQACDLVQQAFVLLYTHKENLKNALKVKNWLFTTMYRLFLRSKKREERYQYMGIEEMENFLVEENKGEITVDCQYVLDCLFQLDEPYRIVLLLYYMDELSYLDISEILNVPIGTVMSRIFRAKKLLRNLILAKGSNQGKNRRSILEI
ncbi:RNA polymerase sigma factor [Candidatus Methylacidiphilum infernorum]|uniref:RNA polymerase sigma factor n=1 Tax=Candidatus Methylacidiphilum infernorum TaxID=511746 RepID=A0ABX7PWB8_9BACT|nr:RNA polymerase sigma factor [Candidatus Methylacidiphilum infernorum]QSR87291.1 RNA polymerase sigma factor [Candidatus Methylacidiphilum infernorum]